MKRGATFLIGLALVLGYAYSVRPPEAQLGYVEDLCIPQVARQVMADHLASDGKPGFTTDRFFAPFGASVPYQSWQLERDWLGGYVWNWDREFPFEWSLFTASLLLIYVGVGWILGMMGMAPLGAWSMALFVAAFNVPRHFKLWYHFETTLLHWAYLSVFLDAWILQRFFREKRFSWHLEAWRGFLLLAMTGSSGYFWGPLILEFLLARVALAWGWFRRRPLRVDWNPRAGLTAIGLCAIWVFLDLRFFLPILPEMKRVGTVIQPIGYFAHPLYLVRPLWLQSFVDIVRAWKPGAFSHFSPIDDPETLVTVGWVLWVPAILAIALLWRKRELRGLVAGPLALLVIAVGYLSHLFPIPLIEAIQAVVPFLKFFRTASRWGVLLPPILASIAALGWPELWAWAKAHWKARGVAGKPLLASFFVLSFVELGWLLTPVVTLPPLPGSAKELLADVRSRPGGEVLDMPFCMTGGNGIGLATQCPAYPQSTAGMCFAGWHGKKVSGFYQGRTTEYHERIFDREPYRDWFSAWYAHRCFDESEWKRFCAVLSRNTDLAAVLVYPQAWFASSTQARECLGEFERRLGPQRASSIYAGERNRGGKFLQPQSVLEFPPKCL